MSWRERLRIASFRGVEFQVESSGFGVGRRTALHEYPFRDEAYAEDLGRSAEKFKIEALVLGDNYDLDRDRLLLALRESGPGDLIHPYLGELRAQVFGEVRVRESSKEGRLARFTITFVEAGKEQFPTAEEDQPSIVRLAMEVARAKSEEQAVQRIEVMATAPSFAKEAVTATVERALESIGKAPAAGGIERAADFVREVQNLIDAPEGIFDSPGDYVNRLGSVVGMVWADSGDAISAFHAFESLFTTAASLLGGQSSVHAAADAASLAVAQVIRVSSIGGASEAGLAAPWSTYEEAILKRDTLAAQIDFESETAGDTLFLALQDSRAEVVNGIPVESEALPFLRSVVILESIPSLVAAYEIHDDISQEGEIVTRNKVRHPGIIPGGRELEVLSLG